MMRFAHWRSANSNPSRKPRWISIPPPKSTRESAIAIIISAKIDRGGNGLPLLSPAGKFRFTASFAARDRSAPSLRSAATKPHLAGSAPVAMDSKTHRRGRRASQGRVCKTTPEHSASPAVKSLVGDAGRKRDASDASIFAGRNRDAGRKRDASNSYLDASRFLPARWCLAVSSVRLAAPLDSHASRPPLLAVPCLPRQKGQKGQSSPVGKSMPSSCGQP